MEQTLFKTIVELMNKVDKFVDMQGSEKKLYVMNETKKILTDEAFERYSLFIEMTIDGLVDISKKNIILYLNKRKICIRCIPK